MKLLLFSDLHISQYHCKRLVALADQADLLVGAGDFGSLRKGIKKTVQWLQAINKPAVVVPGNAESYEELKHACEDWKSATVLHGNGVEIAGVHFYGLGGGIPVTPFGSWSYDFTEGEAQNLLKDCPPEAVLVSHSPPLGILDVSSRGQHLGSKAVRKIIEERSLPLVVCGHIHESGGKKTTLGDTTIINAGPGGVFFDL